MPPWFRLANCNSWFRGQSKQHSSHTVSAYNEAFHWTDSCSKNSRRYKSVEIFFRGILSDGFDSDKSELESDTWNQEIDIYVYTIPRENYFSGKILNISETISHFNPRNLLLLFQFA